VLHCRFCLQEQGRYQVWWGVDQQHCPGERMHGAPQGKNMASSSSSAGGGRSASEKQAGNVYVQIACESGYLQAWKPVL
jgi:hypothetical protein